MKKRINKKFRAFTLAEILITLSIIGVVAALTIPTLIQRTGNEELVARLQKAYSTLSQATEAIMTENGGVKSWVAQQENIYNLYREHLRNAKECTTAGGCFSQGRYKWLDGTSSNDYSQDPYALILSDGTQILFYKPDQTCKTSSWGSNDVCAILEVDINGKKSPNTFGRDVFAFVIKETGLYPRGCDKEGYCNGPKDKRGMGCACNVIQEGDMNY